MFEFLLNLVRVIDFHCVIFLNINAMSSSWCGVDARAIISHTNKQIEAAQICTLFEKACVVKKLE